MNGNSDDGKAGLFQSISNALANWMQYILPITVALFAVAAFGGIFWAIFGDSGVSKFGNAEVARGLITYLVAIVTILIAIILTVSVILGNAPDIKERFALAKEVLTILIGVLGTIIGFYFGSTDRNPIVNVNPPSNAAGQAFQINPPNISLGTITGSDTTVISTSVSGGKPPYSYKVTFDPALIEPITGVSKFGSIETGEIKAPLQGVGMDTEILFQIDVADAEGKSAVLTKDKARKLIIKAK